MKENRLDLEKYRDQIWWSFRTSKAHEPSNLWYGIIYFKDKTIFRYTPNYTTNQIKQACENKVIHRKSKPAHIRSDGLKIWMYEGKLHRINGPAIIHLIYKKGFRTKGDKWDYQNCTKLWYLNGYSHRIGKPAKEFTSGTKIWYSNGKIHRENDPAIIKKNGDKEWYLNGLLHRENGPAVIEENLEIWFNKGKIHRNNGPAKIYYIDGKIASVAWYKNGFIYREDKPSVLCIKNKYKAYHIDNQLHRENGPAVIEANGDLHWFINDKELTEEAFNNIKSLKDISLYLVSSIDGEREFAKIMYNKEVLCHNQKTI